ncbi:MAG: hypothetical protein IJB10_00035 [Clostridia bacterium]|nr:hypothetical protein [Clostridia bacterium]
MKRFLMFLVIAIAVVSLGLTIYYFSTDNEVIYIKSSYLVVNVGDPIQTDGEDGLLDFKNRSEHTKLNYSVEQDSEVLVYNEEGYYLAMTGGNSKIVITTNNFSYSRLTIDVLVCDGSEDYPYIVKTEEDLKNLKLTDEEGKPVNYKLGNDIELTEDWNPLGSYGGVFDGNFFTISNMKITKDTAITDAGLFSVLESTGVIKNLFLTNVNIDVYAEYVGAFAGTNYGIIQTSEATGIIKNNSSGETAYTGGIVGRNIYLNSQPKIDRCGFDGTIETNGTQQIAGGVAGLNQAGIVSETYYRGLVRNGESVFGGIVGYNKGVQSNTANIYDSYFFLKEEEPAKTIYTRMAGITYQNENATNNNMVTGCYFGGSLEENQINKNATGDDYTSQANGYLEELEFTNEEKFITTIASKGNNRIWNFDVVWGIPNDSEYPILNVFSSVGSTYIIDVSDIITGTDITTAQQLYDVLSGKVTEKTYKIAADIDLNPDVTGWAWGDESHPIPTLTFDRQIINGTVEETVNGEKITRPARIENLTLVNTKDGANVGLVQTIGPNAVFSGLVISNVTIKNSDTNPNYKADNVGVIAGTSLGASLYNITIEVVNISLTGETFGGLVGYATRYEGHGFKDITIKHVNMLNSYFVYAGGFVGKSFTNITATKEVYNYALDVDLVANFAGGIVGANGGVINYTTASDITFNRVKDEVTNLNLYSGRYHIFIGGIAGMNEASTETERYKGVLSDVYANIEIKASTSKDYEMYVGGVTGYNSNAISRAYTKASTIEVYGSQNVTAGGIAGYNSGIVSNSVVDKDSQISTSIVASLGAEETKDQYMLRTDNCSVVGGIVGYDARTSNSTASIFQCASYMNTIKGYYVGGLAGISLGKIEKSFCGESTVSNGNVEITGYMAGGLVGVVGGGFVKDCYVFATIKTANFSGSYKNVSSVIKMEVSAAGGLTVLVLGKDTVVEGCYAVTTITGNGARYATSANMDGYTCGTVKNCAYQNTTPYPISGGTRIEANKFTGSDSYSAFVKAIGSNNIEIWDLDTNQYHYPTLEGINVRFPSSTLPTFH